ncbi:MAG: hypothetical protein R2710_30585 [Acidimicrobiales bacterium]
MKQLQRSFTVSNFYRVQIESLPRVLTVTGVGALLVPWIAAALE